jgi:phthalate 4,5-dioxygenase oxygenase subunit
MTVSLSPIVDHAYEHVAPTDQMIARPRRRLLLVARAARPVHDAEGRTGPRCIFGARARSFLHDPAVSLKEAYQV